MWSLKMVTSLRYVINELLVTSIIELTIRLVIAQLHRIPHGRSDESDRFGNESFVQRRPVFLQHGMFCSDIFWLLSSSNNSLGLHSLQLSSFFLESFDLQLSHRSFKLTFWLITATTSGWAIQEGILIRENTSHSIPTKTKHFGIFRGMNWASTTSRPASTTSST